MVTVSESRVIEQLNAANKWGITFEELEHLISEHEAARDNDDTHKMELIEYRLTDLTFDTEVKMLHEGKYSEARLIDYCLDA